jgi:hypothetical protein
MNDKNLQKLEELIKLIDSGVSKEDFTKSFENVIALVLKIEKRNSEAVAKLEETYQNLLNKNQSDHFTTLSDLKKQVDRVFVENRLTEIVKELRDKLDARIALIKDGKDGRDGASIKGDKGERGSSGSPDTPGQVRDKLETLQGDDRLDKSAIKGLEELLNKKTVVMGGGGRNRVFLYDATSQTNGDLKTFSIPLNFGVIGVWSSSFPNALRPIVDYTEGNKTITLTSQLSAPKRGTTLIIQYIK